MPDMLSDPHRPQFHLTPPAGWMNDPNGLIQWQGQYHMFYQHNPHGAFHGTIHWGHAVSSDLVYWQYLPIALAPTPQGPDQDGCWSGCAVDNHGTPTILYTGLSPQVQCLATSHDNLISWEKHAGNPVIAAPPAELAIVGSPPDFRDPFVWREDDAWYLLVGSGIREHGGTALLYRSQDLLHWAYLNPIHSGRFSATGTVWECPNLFPLEQHHVLLISEQPDYLHTYYQLGRYHNHHFTPLKAGKTDHSKYFYAALTLQDEKQRRLMWGWIKEGRSVAAQKQAGWSGAMSLPRVLGIDQHERFTMSPAPELQVLRGEQYTLSATTLQADALTPLELEGDTLEILAELSLTETATFELLLRRSPDAAEQTILRYDRAQATLSVDALASSLDPETEPERASVSHQAQGTLRLHVFVDRSIIEVFADNRTCLTSRVYPTRSDSTGVALRARGGKITVQQLSIWTLNGIW